MNDDDSPETVDERGRARSRSSAPRIAGDRYRIGDRIGRGGMGEVVAARDEQIGREVAIKRIRAEAPSDRAIARFVREAQIQGRLEHPAIVPVHELGRDVDGMPYFAMKKLAGTTLEALLERGDVSRQRLLRAFADVCLAIEFAHVHGIIHRDLKPANIMLGDFGEVYVLDWGIAKIVGEADELADLGASGEGLTAAGTVVGTAGYMAPEQATGAQDVDARADVYSLGCVLAEIVKVEPPPELAVLAARATAVERDERVPTARELAERVQRFLDGDRDLDRRRQLARDQLARARTALAAGDSELDRRDAIAAAGRALALDPENTDASALVAQLVLEPPRELTPEVKSSLASDDRRWVMNASRVVAWTTLAFLPTLLVLPLAGLTQYLWPVGANVLLAFCLQVLAARGRIVTPAWALVLLYAPILTLLAITCSTLGAIGVAIMIAFTITTHPMVRSRVSTIAIFAIPTACVLAPIVLGELGVLPAALVARGDGTIALYAPGLQVGRALAALHAGFIVVLLGCAVTFANVMRVSDRRQRTQLHTITWRLRQLLPR